MKFSFYHAGTVVLIGSIFISGIVNNVLSAICVVMAIICWLGLIQSKSTTTVIGLVAVVGWLFIAAVLSKVFYQRLI